MGGPTTLGDVLTLVTNHVYIPVLGWSSKYILDPVPNLQRLGKGVIISVERGLGEPMEIWPKNKALLMYYGIRVGFIIIEL